MGTRHDGGLQGRAWGGMQFRMIVSGLATRLWCLGTLLLGCAEELPADVAGYRSDPDCVLMNPTPLPERSDDPHEGQKNVYACGVERAALESNRRPFDDGAVLIKESTRTDSEFAWLVSTARKTRSGWRWEEYTRNFADEAFLSVAVAESVCVDCHRKVEGVDWIYTVFSR